MLINAVILFLQNALPIFVITTLLLISFSTTKFAVTHLKWLILGVLVAIIAAFILGNNLESISQTFNNTGMELFLSTNYLLVYSFIITLFMFNGKYYKKQLAFFVFFIISCINGAHFIIYLTNYWSQTQQVESILIGIVLGGGICLSISILLYFVLNSADMNISVNTSSYFLLFFALGQLMHAIVLLQQVDIFWSSQPVWNSSHLIAENSEIGQLLTVLFGYESSPSLLQLITYVIAFIIPVMLRKFITIRLGNCGEKL